tara:strand:+ start:378 stop:1556 length:1179 start_codon:yes stop_codon:yes gene_type:complete
METRSEYILKLLHKKRFVNDWINGKYKEKPIIIYGPSGIGKTSLANHIIQSFVKVEVNIDFTKNNKSLSTFLDLSLYKKSITMMFETVKGRAIIFDDLKHIQRHDKSLFKQILDFSKKKITHPVIYIFNDINHKLIQLIYSKSYPIHISFTKKQFKDIVQKFYPSKDSINYTELIEKSNHNFHNIQINLDFYQSKTNQIHSFQKDEDELFTLVKKVYTTPRLEDIYRFVMNDYNIISLNILENCIHWIFRSKIHYKHKMRLINHIYRSYCIGDLFNMGLQRNYDWELINHSITFTTIVPLKSLYRYNIKMNKMIYNKYLSRSIIYTYNNKLLSSNNLTINILSYIYSLMKSKKYKEALNLCNYYKVEKKICEKFSKYFLSDHKKEVQKLFKR